MNQSLCGSKNYISYHCVNVFITIQNYSSAMLVSYTDFKYHYRSFVTGFSSQLRRWEMIWWDRKRTTVICRPTSSEQFTSCRHRVETRASELMLPLALDPELLGVTQQASHLQLGPRTHQAHELTGSRPERYKILGDVFVQSYSYQN